MGDDVGDALYDRLLVSLLSSDGMSAEKDMVKIYTNTLLFLSESVLRES